MEACTTAVAVADISATLKVEISVSILFLNYLFAAQNGCCAAYSNSSGIFGAFFSRIIQELPNNENNKLNCQVL